jgi:hypothetical protein
VNPQLPEEPEACGSPGVLEAKGHPLRSQDTLFGDRAEKRGEFQSCRGADAGPLIANCGATIVRREGAEALWKGVLCPSQHANPAANTVHSLNFTLSD